MSTVFIRSIQSGDRSDRNVIPWLLHHLTLTLTHLHQHKQCTCTSRRCTCTYKYSYARKCTYMYMSQVHEHVGDVHGCTCACMQMLKVGLHIAGVQRWRIEQRAVCERSARCWRYWVLIVSRLYWSSDRSDGLWSIYTDHIRLGQHAAIAMEKLHEKCHETSVSELDEDFWH